MSTGAASAKSGSLASDRQHRHGLPLWAFIACAKFCRCFPCLNTGTATAAHACTSPLSPMERSLCNCFAHCAVISAYASCPNCCTWLRGRSPCNPCFPRTPATRTTLLPNLLHIGTISRQHTECLTREITRHCPHRRPHPNAPTPSPRMTPAAAQLVRKFNPCVPVS